MRPLEKVGQPVYLRPSPQSKSEQPRRLRAMGTIGVSSMCTHSWGFSAQINASPYLFIYF